MFILFFISCLSSLPDSFRLDNVTKKVFGKKVDCQHRSYDVGVQIDLPVVAAYNRFYYSDEMDRIKSTFRLPNDASDEQISSRIFLLQEDLSFSHSLTVDGMLGPDTSEILERYFFVEDNDVAAGNLWPPLASTPQEQHAHFSKIVELYGHSAKSKPAFLLSIRGVFPYAKELYPTRYQTVYGDTFILLLKKSLQVYVFSGSTHAYVTESGRVLDANGDDWRDVPLSRTHHNGVSTMILPGEAQFGHASLDMWNDPVRWGAVVEPLQWDKNYFPVYRDVDHDGKIALYERLDSLARSSVSKFGQDAFKGSVNGIGDYSHQISFHPGFDSIRRSGDMDLDPFSSIGSHTTRTQDIDYLHCLSEGHGHIEYIVVDAKETVKRLNSLATNEQGKESKPDEKLVVE